MSPSEEIQIGIGFIIGVVIVATLIGYHLVPKYKVKRATIISVVGLLIGILMIIMGEIRK